MSFYNYTKNCFYLRKYLSIFDFDVGPDCLCSSDELVVVLVNQGLHIGIQTLDKQIFVFVIK